MENYNKNERMSNFELLKIISIIFVLFHHFYYNNFELDYTNIKINQIIIQILSGLFHLFMMALLLCHRGYLAI